VELTAILKSALQQSQQNHANKDSNQGEAPKPIQLVHTSFVKQYEVIVLDRAFLRMFLILNNFGLGHVRETFTVISGRIEIVDGCVNQGICLRLPVLYLLVALCHTHASPYAALDFLLYNQARPTGNADRLLKDCRF